MRINNNLMAMNTHRQMGIVNTAQSKSMEKLSSGYRINRAGDDAAGLAISEKMRAQVRGLNQASRNAQDGISMIQTAEGALQETESILQRMRELTVQGSNDTLAAEDRVAVEDELRELTKEVDRISNTTQFNGKKLLDGSLETTINAASTLKEGVATGGGTVVSKVDVSGAQAGTTYTFSGYTAGDNALTLNDGNGNSQTVALAATTGDTQTLNFSQFGIEISLTGTNTADEIGAVIGAGTPLNIQTAAGSGAANFAIGANGDINEKMSVSFAQTDSSTLGTGGSELDQLITTPGAGSVIDTSAKADALTSTLDEAIKQVSSQRSLLGAAQNRLEHTISNLDTSAENLQASESRIRDVDMAAEMMEYTKNNILSQAAQSMLAQANQAPQGVLQLLR